MKIYKCDICGKSANKIDTAILYKKSFDYCSNCIKEAEKIMANFKKEIKFEYDFLDISLKGKERKILDKMKKQIKN